MRAHNNIPAQDDAISGVYSRTRRFPSPEHSFTVDSELDELSQSSNVAHPSFQPESRPTELYSPQAGLQFTTEPMTGGPAPGQLPYASHARDARQYSVSSRASTPEWEIQSSHSVNHISPPCNPPINYMHTPANAHPYANARHTSDIQAHQSSSHHHAYNAPAYDRPRPRPRPRDPNAPSATEDPNFFGPRRTAGNEGRSSSNQHYQSGAHHYASHQPPTVLAPDSQHSRSPFSSQYETAPQSQAYSPSLGSDYWHPGGPGGPVLPVDSQGVIPPTQYSSQPSASPATHPGQHGGRLNANNRAMPSLQPTQASSGAPHNPIVISSQATVPSSRPTQASSISSGAPQNPIVVDSQASDGRTTRPVGSAPSATQPPAPPALEPGTNARGGAPTRRGRGRGRGRGGSVVEPSANESSQGRARKNKGKGRQTEDGATESTPPQPATKRRRTKAKATTETEDEEINQAAAIQLSSTDNRKNSLWTDENSLVFAQAFYGVTNYEFCKENQTIAYRKISEDIFKHAISPEQLKNFNQAITAKYKVFEDVMDQTGMGDATDEAMDNYLQAQGINMSAQVVRAFGRSAVYPIMHEVKDPTILKDFGLDPNRPVSPTDDERESRASSDEDENNDAPVPSNSAIAHPPAPPAATAPAQARTGTPASGGVIDITTDDASVIVPVRRTKKQAITARNRTVTDADTETLAVLNETLSSLRNTMATNQAEQRRLIKSQQDYHEQQIAALKSEMEARDQQQLRDNADMFLKLRDSDLAQSNARFHRIQEERHTQLKEVETLGRLEMDGLLRSHALKLSEQIYEAHTKLPYSTLAFWGAEALRPSSPLKIPALFRASFEELDASTPRPDSHRSETLPPPSPTRHEPTLPESAAPNPPSTPALTRATSAEAPPNNYGEAGPGPRTQANMLAAAGITDV
ncbi:hypothetical protein FRC08_004009 [Ceratobasidium sp. 394]|nr:hypothetical protein FRC08_004009 [Ceratobasidium sp. 394]